MIWFLLRGQPLRGKHKIQDHLEKTIYHVDGQPYVELQVFRITLVAWEGKVKIVCQNLLIPLGGNIEENSENEGNQQGVNKPPHWHADSL